VIFRTFIARNLLSSFIPVSNSNFPPAMGGLTQNSVASYLGRTGVKCKPATPNDPYGYLATCSGKSPDGLIETSVEISSRNQDDDVYLIVIVLYYTSGYSEQVAQQILGYIASIPYNNSEPSQASSWVKQNIALSNNKPTKTFGGITYELSCNFADTSRCLVIGQEPQ
jgi:hypothetical protein